MAECVMIERGKFRFSGSIAETSIPDKSKIKLFAHIQLCKIKEGTTVKLPSEYFKDEETAVLDEQETLKVATTNTSGWFIDIMNNTPYPFFQVSWLLLMENQDGKTFSTEEFFTNLATHNTKYVGMYDLDGDNFIYQGSVGALRLYDTFGLGENILYEYKTFAAALFDDGHYEYYDGFSWHCDSSGSVMDGIIASSSDDVDLRECMDKFSSLGLSTKKSSGGCSIM